jgi:hypothetical protein
MLRNEGKYCCWCLTMLFLHFRITQRLRI